MKLRCGVIGLGRIGCGFDDNPNAKMISTHTGAYLNNKNTELVSFCDVDEKKLKKYGKKYNITHLYTDYETMLKQENLDCLSICTWADSHLNIVTKAVQNHVKGIFLEKPISDSLKNAKRINDLCKKNNIKLQVDYQRRFDPIYHSLKKIISSKKFGKIQNCNINYGGGISNTGSHICDLIRFLFGDINSVQGIFSDNVSNHKLDPNIDGKIICKNNIKCQLQSFDYNKFGLLELDIVGNHGRIKLNLTSGEINYYEVSRPKIGLVYNELILKSLKFPVKESAIMRGLDNLVNAIKKNTTTLASGYEGYSSLEVIIALMISSEKKGKTMFIPINNKTYKITSR